MKTSWEQANALTEASQVDKEQSMGNPALTALSSGQDKTAIYWPTAQEPLVSGYGPATIAEEVIRGHDLRGKIASATGRRARHLPPNFRGPASALHWSTGT